MVRIKDVAKRAGVSTTTVSNVLHGKLDKVSPQVAEQVSMLLKEMGYVPSLSARMLVHRRSRIIGIVTEYACSGKLETEHDRQIAELLVRLERLICRENHYIMLFNNRTEEDICRVSKAWGFSGVICAGCSEEIVRSKVKRSDIPGICISSLEVEEEALEQALKQMIRWEPSVEEPQMILYL